MAGRELGLLPLLLAIAAVDAVLAIALFWGAL